MGVSALALLDHHRIANADDWRIYDDMFSHPLGEWIFTSQNGHRIPLTLALTWIDYVWLEGQMHLLVGVSLAFALGTSLLLWLACRVAALLVLLVTKRSPAFGRRPTFGQEQPGQPLGKKVGGPRSAWS